MAERITGHTELIGLMAYPIRHSSSPAMHNEAFATLGLDYAYLAFEVDNSTLEDAVKGLRALKMVGSNVSMPNKTVVGQYLDELSPAAQMCGAVNTIVNDNGKLIGHITDGIGYMQSLKDNNIDVIGKKMTITGAGGAAKAIEVQAALDGVKEISIFNITDKFWEAAEKTVETIRNNTDCIVNLYDLDDKEKLREEIADSYLFAQATGVGMKPFRMADGDTGPQESPLEGAHQVQVGDIPGPARLDELDALVYHSANTSVLSVPQIQTLTNLEHTISLLINEHKYRRNRQIAAKYIENIINHIIEWMDSDAFASMHFQQLLGTAETKSMQ